MDRLTLINQGNKGEFRVDENGVVRLGDRVCVPDIPELKKSILEEGHRSGLSIHPGATKMYQDLKKMFWWLAMKKEIAKFVDACLTFQKLKIEHQKPTCLMKPLSIPEWKWDSVSMDFVSGLTKTVRGDDSIWVIVDRLIKSAHFLSMKIYHPIEKMAKMYVDEIVKLHGIPSSIVSDRDLRFTSKFWTSLQNAFGTKFHISSADRQLNRYLYSCDCEATQCSVKCCI